MPKYLFQTSYTSEGLAGLRKDKASGRRQAVIRNLEALGGTLEAFYFAFGADDVVIIADLPDNISAAAIALATSASGLLSTRTTILLTVEETDAALAKNVDFHAPGA